MTRQEEVEGFYYLHPEDPERDGQIVEIISRAEVDELVALPMFRVRFADGVEAEAVGTQLHPWYSSDGLRWATDESAS